MTVLNLHLAAQKLTLNGGNWKINATTHSETSPMEFRVWVLGLLRILGEGVSLNSFWQYLHVKSRVVLSPVSLYMNVFNNLVVGIFVNQNENNNITLRAHNSPDETVFKRKSARFKFFSSNLTPNASQTVSGNRKFVYIFWGTPSYSGFSCYSDELGHVTYRISGIK